MVEQDEGYQAQAPQFKQVTLTYEQGNVLPKDTKLHQEYVVWAMVKGQSSAPTDANEMYISENQEVAHINTVSTRENLNSSRFVNSGKCKAIYADQR